MHMPLAPRPKAPTLQIGQSRQGAYHRILRVARAIADLAHVERIGEANVGKRRSIVGRCATIKATLNNKRKIQARLNLTALAWRPTWKILYFLTASKRQIRVRNNDQKLRPLA